MLHEMISDREADEVTSSIFRILDGRPFGDVVFISTVGVLGFLISELERPEEVQLVRLSLLQLIKQCHLQQKNLRKFL